MVVTTRKSLPQRAIRFGVTLMEVIFAIGVILTGLLGLAALIPIAAENAKATMEMDRSIGESTSAAAASIARDFNQLDRMVILDKRTNGSLTNSFGGYEPTGQLQTIRYKVDTDPLVAQISTTTANPIGKLETPGYVHHPVGSGLVSGLCLDPLGMPDLALLPNYSTVGNNAFDYSRFPYYSERYDILSPPNEAFNVTVAQPQWPMTPRMWRVTLKESQFDQIRNLQRQHLVNTMAQRRIFGGFGGIGDIRGKESDGQSERSILFDRTQVGTNIVDAGANISSKYTWMATYSPPVMGGDLFRQSIVVMRQRVAPVPQRLNDVLALNSTAYTVTDPDENPAGERITWVGDWIGFNGGVGGDVQLFGSQSISDEIETGQWVMLSRQRYSTTPFPRPANAATVPSAPLGTAVHRWYRVVRVEDAKQEASANVLGGNYSVWTRWVTLAGSDWEFQDELPSAPPVLPALPAPQRHNQSSVDDTFCTIVSGAISVIESEVVLQ